MTSAIMLLLAFSTPGNSGLGRNVGGRRQRLDRDQRYDEDRSIGLRVTPPVYLLQSSTNQTARTTWESLAEQWNRTTQYTDLFESATLTSLPPSPAKQRPVVMIHCSPKTGSSTLRVACKDNLETTCGVERQKGSLKHFPVGYKDEKKLFQTIRNCTNTSHFCFTEITMPKDVEPFDDVFFVHMFPFRNYDEWVDSALKQQYDRGHETGCNKTKKLLERCEQDVMVVELDFRKYAKAELSKFKKRAVQRILDQKEEHIFLLYHFRELDGIISKLSSFYGIPLLPGSNGARKVNRPEGTCDVKILQMFHDCFSEGLMELS